MTSYSETSSNQKQPLFKELNADEDREEIVEMESLCLQCYKNVSIL